MVTDKRMSNASSGSRSSIEDGGNFISERRRTKTKKHKDKSSKGMSYSFSFLFYFLFSFLSYFIPFF